MDSSGSITQFFYNIVPGSLFIVALSVMIKNPINRLIFEMNNLFFFFIFLSLALLIGFIFQGITKFDRKYPSEKDKPIDFIDKFVVFLNKLVMQKLRYPIRNMNNIVWERVKDADKESDKKALNLIKVGDKERSFYMMHNYLMATRKDKRTDFYMDRVAFWANTYYGNLILIVISLWLQKWYIFLMLLIFTLFSRWLYHEYLKNLYDVVLKTFVVIKENESKN